MASSSGCCALTKVKEFVCPVCPQRVFYPLEFSSFGCLVTLTLLWAQKKLGFVDFQLFLIVRVGGSILLCISTSFVEVGQLLFECLLYAGNGARPYLLTLHHELFLLTSLLQMDDPLTTF